MKRLAVMLALLFISTGCTEPKNWHLVSTTAGIFHFVVIDKAQWKNEDIYRSAIADICAKKNICHVMFWTDASLVPDKLAPPMTDAQAQGVVADWTSNREKGISRLVWSCEINNDPNQCFSK